MDHFFQNIGFYNEKKKRKTTTQETKQKTKNGQRNWIDISPKKICERPTGTWKEALHH